MRVEIESGHIKGSSDSGVHSFRSIPYAGPTGGEFRFLPPQPVRPWAGIKQATAFSGVAPQNGPLNSKNDIFGLRPITEEQSEDCLGLNIWSADTSGKLPVMVWIHGGGHSTGAGSSPIFDGTSLASHNDVVVVTLNHRLGILGHLQLSDTDEMTSGNTATLDLIAALQWIQRNISAFGGDPSRVTLFGESSGAIKIGTLISTSRASGLFHRAVLQSGSPTAILTLDEAQQATRRVAERLGETQIDQKFLSKVPLKVLLDIQRELEAVGTPGNRFGPVYDDRILTRENEQSFYPKVANSVPMIIGTNLDEARYFILGSRTFRNRDHAISEDDLHARLHRLVGDHTDRLILTYRSLYPSQNTTDLLFTIASDQMRRRTTGYAEHLLQAGTVRIHMYLFDWPSSIYEDYIKSCHAMEIPFVFNNVDRSRAAKEGERPGEVAKEMSSLWRSFAQHSIPRSEHSGVWDPYDVAARATMRIGVDTHLAYDPRDLEREAWSTINPHEGRSNWSSIL